MFISGGIQSVYGLMEIWSFKKVYFFKNTLLKLPLLLMISGKTTYGNEKNQHALIKKKRQLPSQTQQKQYEWNGDSPLVASGDKPASKKLSSLTHSLQLIVKTLRIYKSFRITTVIITNLSTDRFKKEFDLSLRNLHKTIHTNL